MNGSPQIFGVHLGHVISFIMSWSSQ